jgi:hypothetical protein
VRAMIIHTVAFRWKPGIPPEAVRTVQQQLMDFAAELPEVRSYRCGSDVGASDMANFDFAIVAEFDSIDDWRVYDKHPRHEEIRAGVVRPWIESRASVQFEV